MSLSGLKPVTCCQIPPVNTANATPHSNVSKVNMVVYTQQQALPPLQVSEKQKASSQESSTFTSRREIMQLTAASLGLVSLLLPPSAEARPKNATMRKKIMEKLEQLRQKAGLSRPKDEAEEKKSKDGGKEAEEKKPKDEGKDSKPNMKNGSEAKKAKPKANGEENKPTNKEQSIIPGLPNILNGKKPAAEEPSVPALPNILNGKKPAAEEPSIPALPNILNSKIVETTLP